MKDQDNNDSLYAVYIVLNQNKHGVGIYFDWENIKKIRLKSKCNHNYNNDTCIGYKKIIALRNSCFDNKCVLKDENLLGIYESQKIDMFWNDFYCFTNYIIEQKLNNETSILDIMERRLKHKKNNKDYINTFWPQLDNVIGAC